MEPFALAPVDLLLRIAEALERVSPAVPPEPDFTAARLFHYEPATCRFTPAPDYRLPTDLLVGVEAQKARFGQNLQRFAQGLPANHALLWGVRGTGKSSLVKAAAMETAKSW